MRIVIDDKIPFIQGVLEPFAQVIYLDGSLINNAFIRNVDALIVRTRTKCDEELLKGTSVKFIATATIGYDHIDTEYCDKNDIFWTNADGCNSGSVLQYIASVLSFLSLEKGYMLSEKTIGVVGVGNVGSKVVSLCKSLGMNVLQNDPPRAEFEGDEGYSTLDEICEQADIITFHVPLEEDGEYPTRYMFNNDFVSKLVKKPVIINTSRGEVIHTETIKQAITSGKVSEVILDVWEYEPAIDLELLDLVTIGTPHIAGYSADGKAAGTSMSVNVLARYFNFPLAPWFPKNIPGVHNSVIVLNAENDDEAFLRAVKETYNVVSDSEALKKASEKFEWFRGHYPIRREFDYFSVQPVHYSSRLAILLQKNGFKLLREAK